MPYKDDKYCENCFNTRKNKASNYNVEDFLSDNWGLNFLPIIGIFGARGIKTIVFPDGLIYHVYIEGRHEKWSKNNKNSNNLKKCDNCSSFVSTYYQLENYE